MIEVCSFTILFINEQSFLVDWHPVEEEYSYAAVRFPTEDSYSVVEVKLLDGIMNKGQTVNCYWKSRKNPLPAVIEKLGCKFLLFN